LLGAFVDRLNLKLVMVSCELAQAVLFAVIAWWQPPFFALLPIVAVAATLDTTFGPAAGSAVPELVDTGDLMQANALLGMALNLQVAVGPLLGGLLVSTFGVRGGLGANAISFVISAALLMRVPRMARPASGRRLNIASAGLEGLAYAWKNPTLRAMLLGLFLVVSFAGVDNVALVFLTRDVLHTTVLGFGVVAAAFGAGMLASSLLLVGWTRGLPPGRLLVGSWFLTAFGTAATGIAPNATAAAALQALAGVGNGADVVASDTLVQQLVPREMLGRIFGVVGTAAFTGSALAYVLAGLLLDLTSVRTTFIVGGVGVLVAIPLFGRAVWRAGRTR
jgi:MFS family permease